MATDGETIGSVFVAVSLLGEIQTKHAGSICDCQCVFVMLVCGATKPPPRARDQGDGGRAGVLSLWRSSLATAEGACARRLPSGSAVWFPGLTGTVCG